MKAEKLNVVNPFYERVGQQYLARKEQEKLKPVVVPEVKREENIVPVNFENSFEYSFLNGVLGKSVMDEYYQLVKKDYNNNSVLNVLYCFPNVAFADEDDISESHIDGSNPFAVVLINKVLASRGLRTATQADLEKILSKNILNMNGSFVDSGLILRTFSNQDDTNPYLTNDLINQIQLKKNNVEFPIMIPLHELELVNDRKAPNDLRFNIKDPKNLFYGLSILSDEGCFYPEDINAQTGLPEKIDPAGARYLYSRDEGLSRLSLNGNRGILSNHTILVESDVRGKIVIVNESYIGGNKK